MKLNFPSRSIDRRGAVAMIAALALVPLVLIVGLAIDYSFFVEARSQVQLAADAAAAHAVRAAAGTYALETAAGTATATANTDAVAAGNIAGANWFQAQLGQMPTATVPAAGPSCAASSSTANPCVTTVATTNPTGFTASVAYQGIYPPFFDGLFKTTAKWPIGGTAGAASQNGYVEVVMLVDTSASMLLGADQTDILNLEDNSVCPQTSKLSGNAANGASNLSFVSINQWNSYVYNAMGYTSASPNTLSNLNVVPQSGISNYTPNANQANAGTCASGYAGAGSPYEPCAFACHTDPNNVGTASQDFYGIARRNGATLRLDVVLSATEQVIQTMIQFSNQSATQLSVGVFQFNNNVAPIVQGTTGTDPLPYEATTNLGTALTDVYSVDFNHKPSETALPAAVSTATNNTDFYSSVSNLISGKNFTSGVTGSLTADATTSNAANATAQQNPAKNIFIVTDGMDDASYQGGRIIGPMTGVTAEQTKGSGYYPGLCQQLKTIGFTVYVLYVPYWSLSNAFYETSATGIGTTVYYANDGGTGTPTPQVLAEPPATTGPAAYAGLAPNVAALQACASSANTYIEADNATAIAADMQKMLKQALSSAIRVTQ
jgi:Flp pilus assembly protein TadG